MKPHKISTHSAHSDNCYFHFFYWLADWVEILWGSTKFFFKQILKVSVSILKNKKVLFLNKILKLLSISKQKSFVYRPNFQWRFWLKDSKISWDLIMMRMAKHAVKNIFGYLSSNDAPNLEDLDHKKAFYQGNWLKGTVICHGQLNTVS